MAEIYDKYKNTVYRTAFAYCRNNADAEDITQEVFIKHFQRNRDFSDEQAEKAWLIRVTANRCKDLFKSFRYRNCTVPLDEVNLIYETPEESVVYHAVMELPAKYRLVIHLYYYEEYSVKEIGVAGHAKCKKLTRKIQKNLLFVKNKPLEQKSRGLNHFIVRISDISQSRTVQISYKSGNLI